ncbi:DNA repair protein Rad52, partial [Aliarcobacter butzleri]
NQYSHPNIKQNQSTSFNQYEYQSLYNLGLNVVEQNGFLIVTGDDIYSKKDSIKACGFRFDSKSKSWYKQLEQRAS